MKKYFYMAVAAIAALSSCSSDDIIQNEGSQNENGVTTFTATIEGENTRATLEGKTPNWEVGDEISIDGHAYTADAAGASTTLTGTGAVETTHHAYFPASLYNSGTPTLPASYQYKDGKFNMPMYAESTTTSLSFKNICGVLAITVPQSEMTSVQSIVVSSDKQMNGEISSITDEGVLTFASATLSDAHKKVTLTATSPIDIPAEGKTFYVPVPAATHNPLTITISDGTVTKALITKKSGGVEVARNNIYSITFEDNRAPWEKALQLGKTTATSIVIETGVAIPTAESATQKKLNDKNNLWEVLDPDGKTLRIKTSAPKIIGHGPFGDVGLFQGYTKVTSITGLDKVDFSEVTDMSRMFQSCTNLTSTGLDLSSFNTSKVTSMKSMFLYCYALTTLNLSTFDTKEVMNMAGMFYGCNNLNSLDLPSSFTTSKVTTMYAMFYDCNKLTSLDLSNFNTSEVTDMSFMFYQCFELGTLNLSVNFNASKVTTLKSMFYNCKVLASLDLSNFNTSIAVTDMENMFYGCEKLETLSLSDNFNTSKVKTMKYMFDNCYVLTSLNLSSFNTSEVTNMNNMFYNCKKLSSLTLSENFVMNKVTDKTGMFYLCGMSAANDPDYKCIVYGASTDVKPVLSQNSVTYWNTSYMKFGD